MIYDAAHAFGVSRNGELAASFGDASMFSFHATKVFNTIEGGAVCFNDPALYPVLNQWKNFGITGPEDVEYAGGNAKMNEFCAAMGLCNLRHVDEEIAKRGHVEQRYRDRLGSCAGRQVGGAAGRRDGEPCVHARGIRRSRVWGKTRDDVFDALAKNGIGARKYFYPLASDYACYRGVYSSSATPVAKWVSDRVLTLPMYAELALSDVNRICDEVVRCAR